MTPGNILSDQFAGFSSSVIPQDNVSIMIAILEQSYDERNILSVRWILLIIGFYLLIKKSITVSMQFIIIKYHGARYERPKLARIEKFMNTLERNTRDSNKKYKMRIYI